MMGWGLGFSHRDALPLSCRPLRSEPKWMSVSGVLLWKLAAVSYLGLLVLGYCFVSLAFGKSLLMFYLFDLVCLVFFCVLYPVCQSAFGRCWGFYPYVAPA